MSSNYVRPPPKECIREFWKTVLQFHQNFFLLSFFFLSGDNHRLSHQLSE